MADTKLRWHRDARVWVAGLTIVAVLFSGGAQATGARTPGGSRQATASALSGTTINVPVYEACLQITNPGRQKEATYISGYTNAAKLESGLTVGFPEPALAVSFGSDGGLQVQGAMVDTDNYVCSVVRLQLDHQGRREFPPVRATFLAFGFTPVTATVHLQQVGPPLLSDCLEPDGTTSPHCPPITAEPHPRYHGSDRRLPGRDHRRGHAAPLRRDGERRAARCRRRLPR